MAAPTPTRLRIVAPPAPWTRALEDGSVDSSALAWDCLSSIHNAPDRFDRLLGGGFDIGENGVRRLILDIAAGAPATAIPVYYGREHMQRNLVVRADSSLTHPRDLIGKRVGSRLTPHSGTSAGVYMMLEQAYGIDLHDIEWYLGDPAALPTNRMGLRFLPGPPSDTAAFDLMMKGELDAVMLTGGPRYWSLYGGDEIDRIINGYGGLRPLITDPGVIADAFRRTGLYAISDLVVATQELVNSRPDLPPLVLRSLADANTRAAHYRDAAENRLAEQEVELLGVDVHQYGLGAEQRRNIAVFIDVLYRLGAIERAPEPEELFLASTLS